MKNLPFALLKPKKLPTEYRIVLDGTKENLGRQVTDGLLSAARNRMPTVLDIETKGNESHNPESQVVGFSLSVIGEGGLPYAVYYGPELWPKFLELACRWKLPLAAHNGTFDWAYAFRDYPGADAELNIAVCTYAWYKHLATEGWLNQRWGLASVMTDMLGWNHVKGEEVAQWLVENGYTKRPIPVHLREKLFGKTKESEE